MKLIDVGDRGVAVLIEHADAHTRRIRVGDVAALMATARIAGVSDVVASPGRVTVVYDPLEISNAAVRHWLETVSARPPAASPSDDEARHRIPVCYGGPLGPDLDDVCSLHGIDRQEFVRLHTAADYEVESIGFLPGFGYLAGLPAALATPRRATPRRIVPAGSVGIGGSYTAAYPTASPGGWNLVGATPVRLFDPSQPRPAVLRVGDRVVFEEIDAATFARLYREPVREPSTPARADITVLAPGLFTTVQDLGRPGHRGDGVPLSGAADPVSLRLANRLVGNDERAAALEITLLGPSLRFAREAVVAVEGAEFPGVPTGEAFRVAADGVLTFGHATTGCRGYLAVAGGIDVPAVLGSRSTCVPAGLGGLPLAAGGCVAIGEARGRPRCTFANHGLGVRGRSVATGDGVVLRVIPGEQFCLAGERLWSARHTASSRSDRMGVRLDGPPLSSTGAPGDQPSVAVLPGAIQLPPDGKPIILLADAQTTGGYPAIGHVITADLPLVGQLRPGTPIRWQQASIAEAHAALRELERSLPGEVL